jgi:hypothetical protein
MSEHGFAICLPITQSGNKKGRNEYNQLLTKEQEIGENTLERNPSKASL